MKYPEEPKNELERLKELESYSILDTLSEVDYDNLTEIASEICNTPISLISLIDNKRQWFKSHHGLNATETPKEHAFCAHAINDPNNVFIIEDAREDVRFHDNPLVTNDPLVIFYAGVPLVTDDGFALGTLCVIDHKPNNLNENQIRSLRALSNQVMNLLKLRKKEITLEKALNNLAEENKNLERFAHIAAHDLKSPLIGIFSLAKILKENYSDKFDVNGQKMLDLIEGSSEKLRSLIDGLLENSKSSKMLKEKKFNLNLEILKNEISNLFHYENELILTLESTLNEIYVNKIVIEQILINLVANAIKYNDKKKVKIEIGVKEYDSYYKFYVEDNGPGIASSHHEQIFKIFEVATLKDKFGVTGNGIGLATVKNLVEKSGGTIKVQSELGKGSKFIFTIEK
jgi:signal transduction histidine kinase